MEEYETLALAIANNCDLLRELKDELARKRLTEPLFDTDRSRRHIERAYGIMWETYERGEAPRAFSVGP